MHVIWIRTTRGGGEGLIYLFHHMGAEKRESGLWHPYSNSVPGQNVLCQHPLALSSKCAMLVIIFFNFA